MDDDRSRPSSSTPATDLNGEDPTGQSGLWERLRSIFAGSSDATLHESLEGIIARHGGDNGQPDIRPETRSMILKILQFSGMRVEDVMVPRADIVAVEASADMRTLLDCFIEANHSRVPVYRETLDDPVGMVHVKDLMRWMSERSATRPQGRKAAAGPRRASRAKALSLNASDLSVLIRQSGLVRDILFVPPSMPAADLLIKMQTSRKHMAIVVDEYGGTDGLLTIEDLVEEIVGDIVDEHDEDEENLIKRTQDGVLIADARAAIEDVERLLETDLLPDEDDEDTDTLGGLIVSMLGRVPVRGELVRHPSGIEFEILGADARRVRRLKIHMQGNRKVPEAEVVPTATPGDA